MQLSSGDVWPPAYFGTIQRDKLLWSGMQAGTQNGWMNDFESLEISRDLAVNR
jgi:hypothetical protein